MPGTLGVAGWDVRKRDAQRTARISPKVKPTSVAQQLPSRYLPKRNENLHPQNGPPHPRKPNAGNDPQRWDKQRRGPFMVIQWSPHQ